MGTVRRKIVAVDVVAAIMQWPGLYEDPGGKRFQGMPVSQVPSQLRSCGWRGVPRYDQHDIRDMGLEVRTARYVGGVHPKRFCEVVVAKEVP
jgi:hypothetical protein